METLQTGEEPVPFNTQRPNTNFSTFESAIVNAMAWAFETPPEVMTLAFSKNYSASRGAVNEYKIFLNKERSRISDGLPKPVYESWFLSMVLLGKLNAPGFLEAWRNPQQYDIYGGWLSSDWTGAIKPSVDLLKEVKGYQVMVQEGWITNEKAAKELTGTKFSKNIRRIEAENAQKAAAQEALGTATAEPVEIPDEPDEPAETEDDAAARLAVVGD
jgi:capsid protein